ncbi:peroxiredoxin-like family protein [Bradyrhizobium neotropicale]|uniref:peroxiredoxin-like family protein n=1 Tax=Bradyrhizobium neotropicale TaxID=1497615 RepID=UPI001AD70B18|nr:peroxiredoxin-like family protein [Bradyrhizobium neotropicale]MBO4222395.1 redoxin domain-containing protein [Bradyrhizobium neotropicale]
MNSLQATLDAFKAELESGGPPYNVPASVVEAMHRCTAELRSSGQAERAMKVGDRAPTFKLKDSEGNVVSSSALLAKGPLIVSFYRGVWCPYCNIELRALQAALPEYEKLGASIVAISPQTQPNSRRAARENGLTFPILSDTKGEVGAAFGLKFKLPGYLAKHYKNAKIDLPRFNDDPEWTLPMPARYVIGQSGTILYAEINADYTRRPEPEELLPALKKAANVSTRQALADLLSASQS